MPWGHSSSLHSPWRQSGLPYVPQLPGTLALFADATGMAPSCRSCPLSPGPGVTCALAPDGALVSEAIKSQGRVWGSLWVTQPVWMGLRQPVVSIKPEWCHLRVEKGPAERFHCFPLMRPRCEDQSPGPRGERSAGSGLEDGTSWCAEGRGEGRW